MNGGRPCHSRFFSESQNKVQNTNDNNENVSGIRPAQQKKKKNSAAWLTC